MGLMQAPVPCCNGTGDCHQRLTAQGNSSLWVLLWLGMQAVGCLKAMLTPAAPAGAACPGGSDGSGACAYACGAF